MANHDDDVLGVYASTSDGKKVTLVIVNKDVVPVNLAISNTTMSVFNASRLLNKTVLVTGASSGIGAVSTSRSPDRGCI